MAMKIATGKGKTMSGQYVSSHSGWGMPSMPVVDV